MRKSYLIGGAALALATVGAANAEVSLSGNVALTNDYMWRGVTQSSEDIAIQGGFDLELDTGFYAGTWASSIAGDADVEVDLYAGYAGAFAEGYGFDVGVIQYFYPSDGDADLDFLEVYGGLDQTWGSFGLTEYVYYDPDNETTYATVGASLAVTEAFSVGANYGKYLDGAGEYYHYDIGAGYSVGGFDFGLSWYEAEDSDDGITFSIGKSL